MHMYANAYIRIYLQFITILIHIPSHVSFFFYYCLPVFISDFWGLETKPLV